MNYAMIAYVIGWILNCEGFLMLLPCLTAVIYQETAGFSFAAAMALCFLFGVIWFFTQKKGLFLFPSAGLC